MAPSPTIRRLLKETSELSSSSKNPNPAFHAAPVSDTDLHEWHFTLLGPPAPSPYAGGLYHGRISLPPSYPLKPPNFRFLTPSGRFEVNREICLSISGFHEETWMPAWGVRTALTALRSFMAESGTAGQVGGLEASKEVRERLAKESRKWRCAECGARTNEEVMAEWWEACASAGVKVGEDVGLEVLPEGLKLEAKIPGQGNEQEKGKEDIRHQRVVSDTTQAILHDGEDIGRSRQDQEQTRTQQADTISASQPSLPQSTPTSSNLPTSPSISSIQQTRTQPQSQQTTLQPSIPPPQTIPSPNPSSLATQPTPPGLRALPTIPHPYTTQRRDEESSTVSLDRAIYIVFVALALMCLKKIFFPAGRGDWDDATSLVRE